MLDFIKGALTDETKETLIQQEYVKQAQRFHGARSYSFISEYYEDRHKKQAFIDENIFAQGYETEDFLKVLSKEKGLGPNIDFFTLAELEALGKKFKETTEPGDDTMFEEGRGAPGMTVMSNQFDLNMRRSSDGSLAKKMTRRPTKKVEGTLLSRHKNVVVIVQNGVQNVQTQFMSYIQNSNLQVDLVTYPFKWKVKRTHADFIALRDHLMRKFPQTIVPPLPRFNSKKKLTIRQMLKKQVYYQRFLACVLKSMVLRSAPFLIEFLKETDKDQFILKVLGSQMEQGPHKINEISTLGGQIDVTARKSSKAFADNFPEYINCYSEINNYIADRVKSIQCKSHELADEFFGVAAEIQRFAALLKSTDIPQIYQLYDRLSQIVLRNGDFILQSGEVLNTQLNGWFKFHREESGALREALNLRQESQKKFDLRYEQLMKQKEKLFKRQDVLAWRVNTEDQIKAERVKTDPAQAYQYILPDTTKEVESLREEAEYFTNQCYREVKRTAMIDYDIARENFVGMGEMMLRLIYQMNIGWQEFLSYYTGLNVARKQYDEKFTEERGIGEEQDDPLNSSSDDEYNQPVNESSLPPRARLTLAYQELNQRESEEKQLAKPLLEDEENKRLPVKVEKVEEKVNSTSIQAMEEERKEGDV